MILQQRINAFAQLGNYLTAFLEEVDKTSTSSGRFDDFDAVLQRAYQHNGWFTTTNLHYAIEGWAALLTKENIGDWLSHYDFPEANNPKVIAIIMAGNIPLVGFHDFLCVLLSGNTVLAKLSSNDTFLLPFLAAKLEAFEPSFKGRISFTEEQLTHHDAVIATGSDNTARYFDYYFGKKPHIIRRNRNSIAILTGTETDSELAALSEDIFRYYGLGCRNVSKLYVPEDYNFDAFFNSLFAWKDIINHHKYANNYDYNKAVYLMSLFELLDNGFIMLKEDPSYSSPIATIFYEKYAKVEELSQKLDKEKDKIQCIVGNISKLTTVRFGKTQQPQLTDYADGVDTLAFLLKI